MAIDHSQTLAQAHGLDRGCDDLRRKGQGAGRSSHRPTQAGAANGAVDERIGGLPERHKIRLFDGTRVGEHEAPRCEVGPHVVGLYACACVEHGHEVLVDPFPEVSEHLEKRGGKRAFDAQASSPTRTARSWTLP